MSDSIIPTASSRHSLLRLRLGGDEPLSVAEGSAAELLDRHRIFGSTWQIASQPVNVGIPADNPTRVVTTRKNTMPDQPTSPSPAALEIFEKVVGVSGEQALAQLDDIAPDFARITIEHGYGGIYAREGLSLRDRELSSISALAAIGGCEGQLRTHLHGALNVGLTAKEITEALIQVSSFAGFPRAINALMVAKEVFQERKVSPLR